MKIATWNVNGIRARGEQVHTWIQKESPDVVCLQEIKAPSAQVPAALHGLDDYWAFWHGFKGYSGVSLLIRKSFAPEEPKFLHPHFDMENRVVMATAQGITFTSIYVPNGGKDFGAKLRFLEELQDFAAEYARERKPLIICGDINIAHRPMDVHPKERKEVTGQLPIERSLLDDILSHGFVDLGRALAPNDADMYTWWAPWRDMRKRNIGWRLDYIYVSDILAGKATSCVVQAEVGTSDHAPVVASFSEKP